MYSPTAINDSSEISCDGDPPQIKFANDEPSKTGNVSFNGTQSDNSILELISWSCWSPAQSIITATPRHLTVPSSPRDIANESLEQCSINKIQESQKKLLSELYGEQWKSIPKLFKEKSTENSVTQLVEILKDKFDVKPTVTKISVQRVDSVISTDEKVHKVNKGVLTEKRNDKNTDVCATPVQEVVSRLSFMGSLADNVPHWRRHPASLEYIDSYKSNREKLSRVLFAQFNDRVFSGGLDADTPILWNTKLRTTAGICRLIESFSGDRRRRTSSIELSVKVLDSPQRLRDTLVHEMCHAATWVIDHELKAAHGPLWKKWAKRALQVFPELGEISRCHDLEIYFKYTYKCTGCGYTIKRHSKSLDVTKKFCYYCRGTFLLLLNKKNKDGLIVSTPAGQVQVTPRN